MTIVQRSRRTRELKPQSRLRLLRLKRDPEAFGVVTGVAKARRARMLALVFKTRGSNETLLARWIAMYLLHTVLRRRQEDIGPLFGRTRNAVANACLEVEALRERDHVLDAEITSFETWLQNKQGTKVRDAA